jgi:hypothetical protein
MKRLLILALLAAAGTSGCFWGERGPRRGDGQYRHGEYREHDERGRHHEGEGREYEHREGR